MDLLTPENHAGAYEWAAVLLAHWALGAIAWAVVYRLFIWLLAVMRYPGETAVFVVSICYLFGWEIWRQRLGAGLADAVVDWSAWTFGALCIWGVFAHRARIAGLAIAGLAVMGLIGVRGRK